MMFLVLKFILSDIIKLSQLSFDYQLPNVLFSTLLFSALCAHALGVFLLTSIYLEFGFLPKSVNI